MCFIQYFKIIPGIAIIGDKLVFQSYSSLDIGLARYCGSFSVKLTDIKLIGISPRIVLDDETLFIIIIDSSKNIYVIPDAVIETKGLEIFEKHYALNSIVEDWGKFEYEDHYGKIDKVIYPQAKYWNDVFKKDWKINIRTLYNVLCY